jgi:hypothetical protein
VLGLLLAGTTEISAQAKPAPGGRGNSSSAQSCYKGGWQNLVTSGGATFASQDQCVAYAAHGGVFGAPKPAGASLVITDSAVVVHGNCTYDITGSGLQPGSNIFFYQNSAPEGAAAGISSDGVYAGGVATGSGNNVYVTGTAADGTTVITSNTVTCTNPAP